jgi:hypothetical protein
MTERAASRGGSSANLFRRTGVFMWFDCLRQTTNVGAPARAIYAISDCLADSPPAGLPATASADALRAWIVATLQARRARYESVPLSTRVDDWQDSSMTWWDPREQLAELIAVECGPSMLRNTRRQFRQRGIGVEYPELHDLAALFANEHLREALISFDPSRGEGKESAWVSTVFFRYALRRVIAARRNQASFDLVFDVADSSMSAEEAAERHTRERMLEGLPGAIAALARPQRHAVALYFGLAKGEHTIEQVARALGTNAYFARAAIASGLGSIAARLGATGLFDHTELRLARQLFVEGADLDSMASSLGFDSAEVRRRVRSLGTKLRKSLRPRTTAVTPPLPPKEEVMLAYDTQTLDLDAVAACLERPGAARIQRVNGVRTLSVRTNGAWHDVASTHSVRQALEDRLDLYERLSSRFSETDAEDPLAVVFSLSEAEVSRQDLAEDAVLWDALIAESSSGALANAEALFLLWREAAAVGDTRLTAEDVADAAARIRSALSTVTSALEEQMPWNVRTAARGMLGIYREADGEDVLVRWYDANGVEQREFSVLDLLRHRFDLVGKFNHEALDLLTATAAESLMDGSIVLPGFTPAAAGVEGRATLREGDRIEIRLAWQSPELESQLQLMGS